MKKGMTPRRSHKSAISSGTLSRRPRSSERASEQRPTILPSSYTGIAAAAGVSRRTCRVCHFDRPTAALSLDSSFFGCVQKIRRNITGYRSGFGSAREEELIPADSRRYFSLKRDSTSCFRRDVSLKIADKSHVAF